MSPAEEFTAERVLKCIASLAVKHNKPTLSENAWNYAMVQVMIDQEVTVTGRKSSTRQSHGGKK